MALSRPRALVLRALGLGDLLTAVPALRGVRRALPDHDVVLATDPALADLARRSGAVDATVPARGLDELPWSGPPPDIAVNLHGRGPQSHRLLQRVDPDRMVAFHCADLEGHVGPTGPRWRRDEHEVDRWCRLVNDGLGADADPADLRLPVPDVPARLAAPSAGAGVVVLVHPGAAYPARRWPVERFAAVAESLAQQGNRVLVTGSAAETTLAQQVAHRAGLTDSAVLAGRTALDDLAALVAHAQLVVCGDTGVSHLASAFGTPSVVLFGPTPPRWWGPPAGGPHTAIWHGSEPGDPWAGSPDPALLDVGVPEVVTAAQRLLA